MVLWLAVFFGIVATILFVFTIAGISRVQSLTTAMGISRVLKYHRWGGILLLAFVALHVVLLLVDDPTDVSLLNPFGGTWASKSAMLGTAALLAIFRIARWQGKYYAAWRWIHFGLAILVVVGITAHLLFLNHHLTPWVLTTAVVVFFLVRRWFWAPLRGRKYSVVDIRAERDGIATVILSPHRQSRHAKIELMKFKPGQFAWVRFRRMLAPEEHPYTIASSTEDNTVEFTVKYDPGSFTDKFANMTVGQNVFLDGPHGDFTPYKRDLVMIAAGVGITPMMSMLRSLVNEEDPRRMILIHIGQPLFSDEIATLQKRLNLTVHSAVKRPVSAEELSHILPARQRRHYHYYVCGPQSLIHDTLVALKILEIPAGRIHTEQFVSGAPKEKNVATTRSSSRDAHGTLTRDGRHRHRTTAR